MTQRVLVFEGDAAFAGELEAELGKHGFSTFVWWTTATQACAKPLLRNRPI